MTTDLPEHIQDAYNIWASQYDTNLNKTRDMEAAVLREILEPLVFDSCLELGCGTGKNTVWLGGRAREQLSVDFSEEMLAKAKAKLQAPHVHFQQADLLQGWHFVKKTYDLLVFSLVLEHIKDLYSIMQKAGQAMHTGSHLYLGELHPFKQYLGSQARYTNEAGVEVPVTAYVHHFSEYTEAARAAGLQLVQAKEYFDEVQEGMNAIGSGPASAGIAAPPRLLALLFRKA